MLFSAILMTSGIKRCMVSQFCPCCFLFIILLASALHYFPSDKKDHIRAVKLITEMLAYICSFRQVHVLEDLKVSLRKRTP
jgi:hypothetical protein